MPVIKSAKKKLRQDRKREIKNRLVKDGLKALIKAARKNPTEKAIREVQKAADKAVKKHLIHKNKAAHIKSSFAKSTKNTEKVAEKAKELGVDVCVFQCDVANPNDVK